jgi:hypothetical protein
MGFLDFTGKISLGFYFSNFEGNLPQILLANGYVDNGHDTLRKYYTLIDFCCKTCRDEKLEVDITFQDDNRFWINAYVPYADYESHPKRELEGQFVRAWNIVLADFRKIGLIFQGEEAERIEEKEE